MSQPQQDATPKIKHVAIAGNIGAGKTTLTEQLAKHFGWDVHYES
ncbi:MAG: deoxynucleoside kinase, partial [Phaeodactylibacter sp.]|nr:deoxynucleoside kinase [Phaeodactylibacter sp.]